jgi:hypothetical protein
MNDRNRTAGQSGHSHPLALAFVAIAVGAIVMVGSMSTRMEAAANPGAEPSTIGETPFVYFPAQYVNQATEIEPMSPTF